MLALLSDDVEPFRGDLSDVDEAEGVEEAPLPSPSLLSTTWGTVLLDARERADDEDDDDDDDEDEECGLRLFDLLEAGASESPRALSWSRSGDLLRSRSLSLSLSRSRSRSCDFLRSRSGDFLRSRSRSRSRSCDFEWLRSRSRSRSLSLSRSSCYVPRLVRCVALRVCRVV